MIKYDDENAKVRTFSTKLTPRVKELYISEADSYNKLTKECINELLRDLMSYTREIRAIEHDMYEVINSIQKHVNNLRSSDNE